MHYKIIQNKDSKVVLEIKIDFQEFKEFWHSTLSQLAQETEVEGFRKGKAPLNLVLKQVGKEKVFSRTLEGVLKEGYLKSLKELNLVPISKPEAEIVKLTLADEDFNLKEDGEIICRLSFEVYPEVKLPEYKKIAQSVKKRKIEVKDQEVDKVLEDLRKMRPQFIPLFKPAEKGDFVEIEVFSSDFPKEKKFSDSFVLGEGKLLPGLESAILGMRAKETKDVDLELPENHFLKTQTGKDKIKVKITLKDVKKVVFPELTDKFAQSLGKFKNLSELRNNIKEGLKLEKEVKESQRVKQEILEKIAQETKVEISPSLVEAEAQRMIKETESYLNSQFQRTLDDYLKEVQKTKEEFEKDLNKEAEKRVKFYLILHQIAKEEKIYPTEEDVEKEANRRLKNFSSPQEAERVLGDAESFREAVREYLTEQMVLDFLEDLVQK